MGVEGEMGRGRGGARGVSEITRQQGNYVQAGAKQLLNHLVLMMHIKLAAVAVVAYDPAVLRTQTSVTLLGATHAAHFS